MCPYKKIVGIIGIALTDGKFFISQTQQSQKNPVELWDLKSAPCVELTSRYIRTLKSRFPVRLKKL